MNSTTTLYHSLFLLLALIFLSTSSASENVNNAVTNGGVDAGVGRGNERVRSGAQGEDDGGRELETEGDVATKNKCARCMRKCERTCSKVNCFADCPTQCSSLCSSNTPICEQPITPGPCKASIPRWGYDSNTRKCVKFVYGGCQGNDNSFPTRRKCRKTCKKKCPRDKKLCPDGSRVSRDPENHCDFRGCASLFCPEDAKECPDGSYVARDPSNNCEFKPCPDVVIDCLKDFKICPDGSNVSRNHNKNCTFDKCPERQCGNDTLTCSDGTTLSRQGDYCQFPDCEQEGSCELPIIVGPCEASIPRWAYDSMLKQCVEFNYGGCGGNDNKFLTREECENACPHPISCDTPDCEPDESCKQAITIGPCKAVIPRWAYDTALKQCVQFNYGGCGGNDNNFQTEEECRSTCRQKESCWIPDCNHEESCKLPITTGPCRAAFPRWAYDGSSELCVPFTYGGCGGNANNFETEEECKGACPDLRICTPAKDHELCPDGSYTSRDPNNNCELKPCPKKKCGSDTLTCSDGTVLYRQESDCQFPDCELGESCKQPITIGPCEALIPRWAYNNTLKQCVQFNYGGCGGNDNNFETQEECENTCPRPQSCGLAVDALCPDGTKVGNNPKYNCDIAPCKQCFETIEPGPCRAAFMRYAYNSETKLCERFTYGGCGGNGNNFQTQEECEQACARTVWIDF